MNPGSSVSVGKGVGDGKPASAGSGVTVTNSGVAVPVAIGNMVAVGGNWVAVAVLAKVAVGKAVFVATGSCLPPETPDPSASAVGVVGVMAGSISTQVESPLS